MSAARQHHFFGRINGKTLFDLIQVYSDKYRLEFVVNPELQRNVILDIDDVQNAESTHLIDTLKKTGLAVIGLIEGVATIIPISEAPEGWEQAL